MGNELDSLIAGTEIPYGGNKVTVVTDEIASSFRKGDRLIVVQTSGDLLHIPSHVWDLSSQAVGSAHSAFLKMGGVSDDAISDFYSIFANRLSNDDSFGKIVEANAEDVELAKSKGRSTTRLILSEKMREDMIAGLRLWENVPPRRGSSIENIEHDGWTVDLISSGLGVIGFIFEGRPNVFADATGVLRSGNTVVFRIGSDALQTANAIVEHALNPSIHKSGLPEGAVSLVNSSERSAGYAMFSDERLALAVARGSGPAVAQLGSVSRQAGIPVSLHGTGGAWIIAGNSADPKKFSSAVFNSLDRKVCNTLNTCCISEESASQLIPEFLNAMKQAGDLRNSNPKLHVTESAIKHIPESWLSETSIGRAEGEVPEKQTEIISLEKIGTEWEWENSPEVTLVIVKNTSEAVDLFNKYSPQFVVSLIAEDENEQKSFFADVNAPFVGNGFTRWVDGQYALNRPELGLSNWQYGRLFGRGGVLSGDSILTIRTKATQSDPNISRRS
ncbi:MAG: aldehyde dehydrogenase family protein [Acidimicrobiales bacterium]|mgnify:FL=1|jgi:glutamate-5-semialdehyde dehydrogenase|nr:aldehyde dehydrogenase family protein [Acidimicrobiales bacterium]HJM28031.1 aldehyde dehydrogenase family protein [Acidimicrobiales bacterium]HJM96622.1 aldehyde dehydrogenase family protein [Acidimicrobiales bacterium]